jgi:hyaluronan synthase
VSNAALAVSVDTDDDVRVPPHSVHFGTDAERLRDRHLTPLDALRETRLQRCMRGLAALCVIALCALISWHIEHRFERYGWGHVASIYTIVVTLYVLSRFALATLYRAPKDAGITPSIAIIVPSYNEGEAVRRTIHGCMAIDYPRELIEVVVINDGSTDDTWDHMESAASEYPAGAVQCVDLGSNQGKRAAMAAGIRRTSAEVLVFVDSDSVPAPRAIYHLVQPFAEPGVAAVSGLTYVRNAHKNLLTRMQAARYYVSFQLLKTAESMACAVTCCSGCFAAYRRDEVLAVLEPWEHQTFLGAPCTHGDDRALTNMLLRRGHKARYQALAEAWTDAPEQYGKFFRQQLRWKKSWSREGFLLATHIWRSRPLAFPAVLIQTFSGYFGPLVMVWNLAAAPGLTGVIPIFYFLALYMMATAYALLYRALRGDGMWRATIAATFFYAMFAPQIYWAILRIRDGAWGTRALVDEEATAPHDSTPTLHVGAEAVAADAAT